ncbi:MAG: ABC transporter permease [Mobilitalea sp.]
MAEEKVLAKEREEERIAQQEIIKKMKRKNMVSAIIPFLGVVFIFIFFAIVTDGKTVSSSNITNLVNQSYTLIIVAVGATFVYAYGGMDMSCGAVQGLVSVIIAYLALQGTLPAWMMLPIAIIIGMMISSINGILSVVTNVPVFVVSLCINFVCTGAVATIVSKADIYMPYAEYSSWNNNVLKTVILILVIAVGYYVFEYTKIGKNLKAIGGNKNTAEQSGIKSKVYIIVAYMIIGASIGLISFFTLTRTGTVSAQTGAGLMLDVLTAIVLGGFPLAGGAKSKIRSAVLGAIIVAMLSNGLTIWGVDPNYVGGIQGILFLVIVYLSYERRKGEIFD